MAFFAVVKPPGFDLSFDTFALFLHCSGNPPKSARSKLGPKNEAQHANPDRRNGRHADARRSTAYAAEVEGQIKKIDIDHLTITLDNGKSYKLPGELDVSTLKEGMEIVLAYDEVGGENVITDMDLSE